MNEQIPPAVSASDGRQLTAAEETEARRDGFEAGPASGPLPPVYVPPPARPGPASLLWHAAAWAARRAGGWVTRHLPRTLARVPWITPDRRRRAEA
jgi:hypothetical protein